MHRNLVLLINVASTQKKITVKVDAVRTVSKTTEDVTSPEQALHSDVASRANTSFSSVVNQVPGIRHRNRTTKKTCINCLCRTITAAAVLHAKRSKRRLT